MSNIQGEQPESRRSKIVAGIVAGVLTLGMVAGAVVFVTAVSANAQAHAHLMSQVKAEGKILTTAVGADTLLSNSTVTAGQRAHLAQLAAEEQAATDAAKAAAAAQAAALAAAQQQAAATTQARTVTGTPVRQASAAPIKCPAGTIAQAVDANGNESNCTATGPGGAQCTAYDANNNCTNWYKP